MTSFGFFFSANQKSVKKKMLSLSAVCIFVQLNWLPFLNDERVNDSCADEPTLSNITSRPALIRSGIKLLMNQLSHRMPLFKPMILIVSFSRASFSYTTPLIMMATEYIHARVMKRGIDRLITRRKLGGGRWGGDDQSYHSSVYFNVEFGLQKVAHMSST